MKKTSIGLRFLKPIALLGALCGALLTMLGCATLHGVGQDVEHVGDRIQEEFK